MTQSAENKIRIIIDNRTAEAIGPFPFRAITLFSSLAGRKTWKTTAKFIFEAVPENINKIKESDLNVEFEDRSDTLKHLEQISNAQSQHAMRDLPTLYTPAVPLYDYQNKCLSICWDREVYGIFLEMGLGKTAITIANIGMLWAARKVTGALIVAPKGVHLQWAEDEIPKHLNADVPHRIGFWDGRLPDAKRLRAKGLTFYCINIDALKTAKGYEAARMFLNAHKGTNMIVIDESHKIKNYQSDRSVACLNLGKLAQYKRILTGTPIANNVEDLFGQFYFLDYNILGHRFLTSFRSRYCIVGGHDNKTVVGVKNVEELYNNVARHSFRMRKNEALDLPDKRYHQVQYEMSAATLRHYNSIKNTLLTQFDDGEVVDTKSAAVSMIRLQQVLSGYLPREDGSFETFSNERLEILDNIIDQITGPVVIWSRFTEDITRIVDMLKKKHHNEGIVTYYGLTKKSELETAKKDFVEGRARFFVANMAKGGTGTNLQGYCENVIYFNNSFNAIDRWQSEDRTHRIGMKGGMTYFDISARKSIDQFVRRNLLNKQNIASLALDTIRLALEEAA